MSKYNDQEIARFEAIERAAKIIHDRDGSLKLQSGREWQPVPSRALAELEEALYRYDSDTVTITISSEDAAWWSARDPRSAGVYERNIATACRAALEEDR